MSRLLKHFLITHSKDNRLTIATVIWIQAINGSLTIPIETVEREMSHRLCGSASVFNGITIFQLLLITAMSHVDRYFRLLKERTGVSFALHRSEAKFAAKSCDCGL